MVSDDKLCAAIKHRIFTHDGIFAYFNIAWLIEAGAHVDGGAPSYPYAAQTIQCTADMMERYGA